MTITVAVDGSALGNPGPAGWAWYIDDDCWDAGGWMQATNNRGELQAVIEILHATAEDATPLHILCDSQYVINSVTKWMPNWKRRGWKKADGRDVQNRDLMEALDAALAGRSVEFEWVKGHSSHALNDAADERARAAAGAFKDGTAVPSGPGFTCGGGTTSEGETQGSATQADSTPAVQVSCLLERELADSIVSRAHAAGRTPQQELARLIRLGAGAAYGADV
ncbi:ribonuclease H family protein [Brevibacterium otitidis]|uniref:Ribonuclease H n=1 Tax=Brevibacterium otitidis TaxID=53364 RepID=A0ABV5X3M1_9MICO